MNSKIKIVIRVPHYQQGFTLVELLVALGLVSLLMLLFAQVFQIATGTMSTQRGVMENDQRARSVTLVLRSDLARRSFRSVVPWSPGELGDTLVSSATAEHFYSPELRRGYFSISENSLLDQSDDVLQFTVDGSQSHKITKLPQIEYYGRAAYLDPNDVNRSTLLQRGRPVSGASPGSPGVGYIDINDAMPLAGVNQAPFISTVQPGDTVLISGSTGNDGQYLVTSVNDQGGSITRLYFSSNISTNAADGRVYRATSEELDFDDGLIGNATASSPYAEVSYFVRNAVLYRRTLLIRDREGTPTDLQPKDDGNQRFFDFTDSNYGWFVESAANGEGDFWRGLDFAAINDGDAVGAQFLGRTSLSCDKNQSGTISITTKLVPFSLGVPRFRFGHNAFSLEGRPREFVDAAGAQYMGRFTHQETSHSKFNYPQGASTGGFNPMDGSVSLAMDSRGAIQPFHDEVAGTRRGEDILLTHVHSFDIKVWDQLLGQFVDIGHRTTTGEFYFNDSNYNSPDDRNLQPGYGSQRVSFGKNRCFDTWHPEFNFDGAEVSPGMATIDDPPPYLPLANRNVWQANFSYASGDIVVPTDYLETYPTNANRQGRHLAFRCTTAGTSNSGIEPTWPANTQSGALISDGSVTWEAIYNSRRLGAIQITIRYLDVTSDQMRQVTLIQSLLE